VARWRAKPHPWNRRCVIISVGAIATSLSIEVPDDIQSALQADWGDLSHRLREDLAVEGYRQGLLTLAQVRRLLQLRGRWEAQQFLGQRGVAVFDFDPSELDREATLQESIGRPPCDPGGALEMPRGC